MIEEPVKYITKVEIQGLFGRYDIEWNLHPDVNVLAGINGSGKTTILNCIYGFFFNKFIKFVYFKNVILSFDNSTCINLKLSIKYTVTHLQEVEKKVSSKNEKESTYDARAFELLSGINLVLIRTFDSEARPQELLEKADNKVKSELDFELWKLQKEYTKYQVRIYKYDSETNRDTHIRFLAIIDELFSETHKKINPDKEELEFLLDDKEISTYQLSSGEKQLLVILLTVLVQDNKPAILLMDEPEISLHIEWQRKLIKYIRILNPNAQIIIATHSPDIIVHGWLDNVFNLQDLIVKDNTVL